MRKIAKIAVGITLAASLAATAGALAGCGDAGKTGEAYALTHGTNRYIGYSKVTVKGDKVTDVVLTEVELPTQLTNDDKSMKYTVVTYGEVTMTYNADDKAYYVGTQNISEYFKSEANCKAYYEAAIAGNIKGAATADGTKETITKAVLSKEDNGYWTRQDKDGKNYSRWKVNRDATVDFVKANGVSALSNLTKKTTGNDENGKPIYETVDDAYGVKAAYWMSGTLSTGATWSDLYNTKTTTELGYYTYAALITAAYTNATK